MSELIIDIDQLQEELDKALLTNPDMEEKIRKIISNVLAKARGQVSASARQLMASDPRQAYKAVRRSVYKQILGGQINIMRKRRAGAVGSYVKTRTLRQGQRGGNRRPVSADTLRMESYTGSDRGFILRFLNKGTGERETRYGKRGTLPARAWFSDSSMRAMNEAADELAKLIDQEIKNVLQ